MTSMLLRLSMSDPRLIGAPRPAGPQPRDGLQRAPLLLRAALLDVLGHHVLVRGEPVGLLLELAALDLPDLYEPTALVVRVRDPERRHQPAEREVRDLLEAVLGVDAGDLAVRLGLQGVADGLDVERGDEHAAVVEHGRRHLLRRLL